MTQLPFDVNAEQATLGSILLERDAIIVIAPWLQPEYFYLQKHGWIYAAMLTCYQQRIPPDILTVADELRRREQLESAGGLAYLSELVAAVPTAVHIEYYARTVERTALMRQLVETGGKIATLGYDEDSELTDLVERARLQLENIRIRDAFPQGTMAGHLMAQDHPAPTWFIPGLLSHGFGYLAAKPGTGKTWLFLQWAVALAAGGYVFSKIKVPETTVLFLALEDEPGSIAERLRIVCKGNEPPGRLFVWTELDGLRDLSSGGLQQLEQMLRYYRPGVVFIDTLTAIAPAAERGTSPYKAEYQAYIPIRRLADQYRVCVLGSWHFNKAGKSDTLEMVSGTMGLPAVSVNRLGLVRDDSNRARLKAHSKRGASVDWIMEFDSDLCQWSLLGDTLEVNRSEQQTKILDYLQEMGRATVGDIVEATGMEYNNLLQLLKRLRDNGILSSPARGVYECKC